MNNQGYDLLSKWDEPPSMNLWLPTFAGRRLLGFPSFTIICSRAFEHRKPAPVCIATLILPLLIWYPNIRVDLRLFAQFAPFRPNSQTSKNMVHNLVNPPILGFHLYHTYVSKEVSNQGECFQ